VPPSRRVLLARLALGAAQWHPDVVAGRAGPHGVHRTADTPAPLDGVTVTAGAEGRYDVELHLVARPVPLHALAAEVTARVQREATTHGLGPLLGSVSVAFEDVAEDPA
jgi:hypothetical protein